MKNDIIKIGKVKLKVKKININSSNLRKDKKNKMLANDNNNYSNIKFFKGIDNQIQENRNEKL